MKTAELLSASRIPSTAWWTLCALALVIAWDASGLDLPMARLFADGHGFALRDSWLLADVLHQGARRLAWVVSLWLFAGIWWPTGVLRQVPRSARVQWLATTLLSLLLISALKHASLASCPWDLAEFGGAASHVSHWAWLGDGGPGRCFPAGHASAGFAFVGAYFAFRGARPRGALLLLALAVAAGLVLGLAQQLRGAHFMSHTLWTGWLCWASAWCVDTTVRLSGYSRAGILSTHETS